MTPEQLKTRCEEIRSILDSGNQNRIDANRQKIADFAYAAAEVIPVCVDALYCECPENADQFERSGAGRHYLGASNASPKGHSQRLQVAQPKEDQQDHEQ